MVSMDQKNEPHGTYDQLSSSLQKLVEIQTLLPFCSLTTAERRELSGHLFLDGPGLVMAVAWALRLTGLEQQQRLAFAWLVIRDALRIMAQQAHDTYLTLQAGAIKQAMAEVRPARRRPAEEEFLLVPAYFIVHAYYEGLTRKRAQKRAGRQAAGGTVAPQKTRTPAQQRSARKQRESHRARLHAQFQSILDQLDR